MLFFNPCFSKHAAAEKVQKIRIVVPVRKVPHSRVQKHLLQKNQVAKQRTKSSDAKPSGTTIADSKATASSTKEAANNGSAEKQSPAKNANPDDQANQVLNQLANMFPGQGLPQAILTSQTNNF